MADQDLGGGWTVAGATQSTPPSPPPAQTQPQDLGGGWTVAAAPAPPVRAPAPSVPPPPPSAVSPDTGDQDQDIQAPASAYAPPTRYGRNQQGSLVSKWNGSNWVDLYNGKKVGAPAKEESGPQYGPGQDFAAQPPAAGQLGPSPTGAPSPQIQEREIPPAPQAPPILGIYARKPGTPTYVGPGGRTYTPSPEETTAQTLQKFLLSPPPFVQDAVKELNQIMVGPFQIIQKGIIEPAAGMISPAGAAMAVTGAGLGAAAASSSAQMAAAGKAADAALSTFFTGLQARQITKEVPEAYDAYQKGDYWGALGELGAAGTSAFLGTLAGMHAAGQLSDVGALSATRRALQERLNAEEAYRAAGERADAARAAANRPRLAAPAPEVPETPPVPGEPPAPAPLPPEAAPTAVPTPPEAPPPPAAAVDLGEGWRTAAPPRVPQEPAAAAPPAVSVPPPTMAAAPPTAAPAAGAAQKPEGRSGEDLIRGSTNIPLSPQGVEQANQIGQRFAQKGGLDLVVSSDMDRAVQTAAPIAQASGAYFSHATEGLHPWYLGEVEGQPTEKVLDRLNGFIDDSPDKPVPGRSEGSTQNGEAFNTFKERAIGTVQDLMDQYAEAQANDQPIKIGAVTHYRDVKLLHAWADAGFPENLDKFQPSSDEMTGKDDPPGSVQQISQDAKGKWQMQPVDMASNAALQPGIYIIRHSPTVYNAENRNIPAPPVGQMPQAQTPVRTPPPAPAVVQTPQPVTPIGRTLPPPQPPGIVPAPPQGQGAEIAPVRTPSGATVTPNTVSMERADFEQEHTDLPRILREGTPAEREKEAAEQAQELKEVQAVNAREPGWVGNVPTSEIKVDAPRFQFKANVGQGGVGEESRDITRWDPEKSGVLAVWKDPADGQTYVVNGHNRLDLARRLNVPEATARYLVANNAQEARLKGALINIAEGRGEATDAAKIFRDSRMTPEQLRANGVSLTGKVASEGLALSNLSQPIFDDVINGTLPVARGAVIGAGVPNHADQQALYDLMRQREQGGKRLTNDQLGELIRLNQRTSTVTERPEDEVQTSMFGEEEMTRSLLPEKAEISDYVRKQLAAEKKLFGTVAAAPAAERLTEAGNIVLTTQNAQIAERANQGILLYDRLSTSVGPIDSILDQSAKSLAGGESAHEVKQSAYRQVRNLLAAQVRKLTGVPQGHDRGVKGLGEQGPRQAGPGEYGQPLQSRAVGPLPGQQSFLVPETEAESRAIAQLNEARLLHDQLTAQIRSGMAAKPGKLKPAKTRDLFAEEGPEQGGLFARRLKTTPDMFRRVPEVTPGGRGFWVYQGKVIDAGTDLHATVAQRALPGSLFQEAVGKLMGEGAIRVRGENLEMHQHALDSSNLQPAVEQAVKEAQRKRAREIGVEVRTSPDHADYMTVPLPEVGEFLASPRRYMGNRAIAALQARRRVSPDQLNLLPGITRLKDAGREDVEQYWEAADSKPTSVERVPCLLVNNAAMDAVLRNMGPTGRNATSEATHAVALNPAEQRYILAAAKSLRGTQPNAFERALLKIARQIRTINPGGRPLPVIQTGASITGENLALNVQEEIDHSRQLALHRGLYGLPVEVVETPLGARCAMVLAERAGYVTLDPQSAFYEHNRAVIAAEIGVRLMRPGRYHEMGVTADEAEALGQQYIRHLKKHPGAAARVILEQIDATIRQNQLLSLSERNLALEGGEPLHPEKAIGPPGVGGAVSPTYPGGRPGGRGVGERGPGDDEEGGGAPSAARSGYQPQPLAARAPKVGGGESRPVREFLGEEAGTSRVGEILKADIKEALALKSKRDAAIQVLEEAKADPAVKDLADRLASAYLAERNLWATRVNQVIGRLRKLVPSPVDQEGIAIMRDMYGCPGELEQWAAGTHPNLATLDPEKRAAFTRNIDRLGPAIERAQNPTPEMIQADQVLTKMARATMMEGQMRGIIERGLTPERYFTHLLWPKGEGEAPKPASQRIGQMLGGKISRYFAFAEHRSYPTIFDAIADGVRPKTLNAFDAATIHGDKFATARATRILQDELEENHMGVWGAPRAPGIPENWVELAPHARLFRNEIPVTDQEGKQTFALQTFWTPQVVSDALRPITDPDYMRVIKGFGNLRARQALLKQATLSLSLFHARALNLMAFYNLGPVGITKGLLWFKRLGTSMDNPDFERAERQFVMDGGTTTMMGKSVEAYKSLEPGSIPTWTDIWRRVPVIREMDAAANTVTRGTFDILQRFWKVTDYQIKRTAWMAKHPGASQSELSKAGESIAKEINAVYGGLNWEKLGANHATVEALRAIMLAPDWTISNIFNVKYALEGTVPAGQTTVGMKALGAGGPMGTGAPEFTSAGKREWTPAGKAARLFWMRAAAYIVIGSELASFALTRRWSKRPTRVLVGTDKDGRDVYENWFAAGAPQDVQSFIDNSARYGALGGAVRTMTNKAAPLFRTGLEAAKNEDFLGRPIVPRGMNFWAATARGGIHAAKGLAPIPYSFQNAWNMLAGPDRDRYKPGEVAATILTGTPPIHVRPQPPERPKLSTWEQIKQNRVYQKKPAALPPQLRQAFPAPPRLPKLPGQQQRTR